MIQYLTERWMLLIIAIVIVVVLFLWNQYDLDCIDQMPCNNMKNAKTISDRVDKMSNIPVWRQALITAIIVTIPIVFIYKCNLPSIWDWMIIVPIVFLSSYFSYSWIMYHFYHPNAAIIKSELNNINSPEIHNTHGQ